MGDIDPTQRQVIDALLLSKTDKEFDSDRVAQAYWRAFGILDREEPSMRHLTNWCQDDDGPVPCKQLVIPYESETGKCTLVLTDFYQWPSIGPVQEGIRLEVYPYDQASIGAGHFHGRHGEIVFALNKNGAIDSPLGFVDSNITHSLLALCEEEQICQHAESAERQSVTSLSN